MVLLVFQRNFIDYSQNLLWFLMFQDCIKMKNEVNCSIYWISFFEPGWQFCLFLFLYVDGSNLTCNISLKICKIGSSYNYVVQSIFLFALYMFYLYQGINVPKRHYIMKVQNKNYRIYGENGPGTASQIQKRWHMSIQS